MLRLLKGLRRLSPGCVQPGARGLELFGAWKRLLSIWMYEAFSAFPLKMDRTDKSDQQVQENQCSHFYLCIVGKEDTTKLLFYNSRGGFQIVLENICINV